MAESVNTDNSVPKEFIGARPLLGDREILDHADASVVRILSGGASNHHQRGAYDGVRRTGDAYPPDRRDLFRLYNLVRSRRVTTVLEFGVGFSTSVLADALRLNKLDYDLFVSENLRRSDTWKVFSVDDSKEWIQEVQARIPQNLVAHSEILLSAVQMTTFQGRICTEYLCLPNVCPDLIYLDAPSLDLVRGEICGISTRHFDRLPMACDILKIEHFLLPGTLIVIDGRTANSRFLVSNLQRNWRHYHDENDGTHFLELRERPLGRWNAAQIKFCLGNEWWSRVD